jgi:phosphomannomutase
VSVLFSYEEALGYCVGDVVADKDGVSAAAVFVEMAGELLGIGCTVHSYLQSLHAKYGQFISYNSYLTCHVPAVIDAIFSRLRKGGPHGGYWHSCGGVIIISTKDVTLGYDSASYDKTSDLPTTKDSNMIMYEFANGCSVTLRTSGTEPKIKFYTEIAGNRSNPRSKYELEKELKIFVDVLINEFLQPDLNNLVRCS